MEFTGYKTLKFTRSGRILTISFNRPEAMNAVNGYMHHDLARVFTEANDDEGSDIIVLTGEGRALSPRRCALPITALRLTPPSSSAIWLAVDPPSHILVSFSIRSSVQLML